jgi:small conductance mechanosensitive channel
VGREYRRRVKLAFDEAGIDLALPHQQIWISNQQQTKEE